MINSLKILMLEDSDVDAEIVQRVLRKERPDFEFLLAMNKEDYLKALENYQPDLVLCDNSLPQFDATEAMNLTRELIPHIPFIMVTGTVSEEYAVDIIKSGADDYILKDRLMRLPSAIDAAVKQRGVEKEKLEAIEKLTENEEKYRSLIERVSDGFIALDANWLFTYMNKKAEELFNRPPGYLLGKNIWAEYPEAIDKTFYKAYHKAMATQENIYLKDYSFALDRWLEANIYPSATGVSVYFRDFTEQKKAEQQKEFDSNNLTALINNTHDLMWSVDKDLKLITFNDAFNRAIELTTGNPLIKGGDILSTQFTEDQLNRYKIFYARALSGEIFTVVDHFENPIEFWSEISFYPIRKEDTVIGTACYSRDITQRKKTEKALLEMEQQILSQKIQEQKKISRAIIKAQEKEKNHIGQELHDNISQILVSTKLFLFATGHNNEAMKELIKYPLELIDNSIQEIRSLSSRQVTPLKNINLKELVQTQLNRLTENTEIKTTFVCHMVKRNIDDDLKLNIYRIIQEQTNNIMKYAKPKHVNISIESDQKNLRIVTVDDGKGFDVKSKRKGIGISNMFNRIESFNGEMTIESSPGKGCKTHITIPYK